MDKIKNVINYTSTKDLVGKKQEPTIVNVKKVSLMDHMKAKAINELLDKKQKELEEKEDGSSD
jgi:hypothetical protein